jgi:multidrug efflux pump
MTGIIDWAASRARMVIAFVILSLTVGTAAYVGLPKEGEPDIDIPGLFVSVPFPGISAEDSERLLIKPMESEFQDLDGLTMITATASEGFAGLFLEFEFGWDKSATIADVRDAMGRARRVSRRGRELADLGDQLLRVPDHRRGAFGRRARTHADPLANRDAGRARIAVAGAGGGACRHRDEMLEVILDPLALEAYDVTAQDLINAVVNNNQLIAAGDVETASGAISRQDPVELRHRRGCLRPADHDQWRPRRHAGRACRYPPDLPGPYGHRALQRRNDHRAAGGQASGLQRHRHRRSGARDGRAGPRHLAAGAARGSARGHHARPVVQVDGMVRQLEGSVLTAIALVMIVVLAALGTRSAMLVGFAIPTSFLLCFILLGVMGIPISNIVMFGLILAVGMLVDGAIVVVEYADKRLKRGRAARCRPIPTPPSGCSGPSCPPPRRRFAPSCRCCSGPVCRASSWACCR